MRIIFGPYFLVFEPACVAPGGIVGGLGRVKGTVWEEGWLFEPEIERAAT